MWHDGLDDFPDYIDISRGCFAGGGGDGSGSGGPGGTGESDPGHSDNSSAGMAGPSSAADDDDMGFADNANAAETVGAGMNAGPNAGMGGMGVGEFGTNDIGLGWGILGELANYAVNNPVSTLGNLAFGLATPVGWGIANTLSGLTTGHTVGSTVGNAFGETGVAPGTNALGNFSAGLASADPTGSANQSGPGSSPDGSGGGDRLTPLQSYLMKAT